MLKHALTLITHRIHQLPVLVLMPHSRCNCRCIMCDIWKANSLKKEISLEELSRHVDQFKKWQVREVLLSGGEPLMHSNLWDLISLLSKNKISVTLLSTGLLLEKYSNEIINNCAEVIVSLDGNQEIHNQIRNIPNAFEKLAAGVQTLKKINPRFKVTARCVIQKKNYFAFDDIVMSAKEIGLDRISFLAADVSTVAFNRDEPWAESHVSEVALNKEEALHFETLIQQSTVSRKEEYEKRFIAESPDKMNRIVQYFKALNGIGDYTAPSCNAPWVSAVIESDGSVLPCFFQKAYGNIFDGTLNEVINSKAAIQFRKELNVETDSICKKCVCSLKIGMAQMASLI
jgi:MoaA/NifB/PqqE/SkfB family radical SAM enzyme